MAYNNTIRLQLEMASVNSEDTSTKATVRGQAQKDGDKRYAATRQRNSLDKYVRDRVKLLQTNTKMEKNTTWPIFKGIVHSDNALYDDAFTALDNIKGVLQQDAKLWKAQHKKLKRDDLDIDLYDIGVVYNGLKRVLADLTTLKTAKGSKNDLADATNPDIAKGTKKRKADAVLDVDALQQPVTKFLGMLPGNVGRFASWCRSAGVDVTNETLTTITLDVSEFKCETKKVKIDSESDLDFF